MMDFFNIDLSSWIRSALISIVPFMFAITVHEVSHGFVAYLLGDNTAKNAGRLTLNPIKHIDLFGLLFLLVTRLFGWAKPVPVDFRVVSRTKHGPLMVAAAGPCSNFILAILSVILLIGFMNFSDTSLVNVPYNFSEVIALMLVYSIQINVALAVFNLIPILPLDGGRILQDLLPPKAAYNYGKLEQWGFIILIILFFTEVIQDVIGPVLRTINTFIFKIVLGGSIF